MAQNPLSAWVPPTLAMRRGHPTNNGKEITGANAPFSPNSYHIDLTQYYRNDEGERGRKGKRESIFHSAGFGVVL